MEKTFFMKVFKCQLNLNVMKLIRKFKIQNYLIIVLHFFLPILLIENCTYYNQLACKLLKKCN